MEQIHEILHLNDGENASVTYSRADGIMIDIQLNSGYTLTRFPTLVELRNFYNLIGAVLDKYEEE
jgi:hypothetical protein